MNRVEMTRQILTWEAVATRAKELATELRDQLAEAARTELDEQGTAPTWLMPDLATVTLSMSKPTTVVSDTYLPDGEIVPGLEVRPGGQPKTLAIRADPACAERISAEAEDILVAIAGALGESAGIDDH